MSFSYGFYNSLNHDRVYDATVIGQLFDGMIMDGVYSTIGDKFIVHASGQGMRVNVGSGRAWFNHTWNFNDTDYPITPEDAEVILDRIDALVIDVNTQVEYRENQIMFVKGTPSSTPERPTLANSDGHYQYPLAYILIPASSTEVLEANITNMVGTDECPFATGLLQQVSTSELIAQWGAEWRLWSNQEKAAFINWMNSEEADFDSWSDAQKTAFTLWMGEEKTEFDEWFANIQDILDGDVAGHLQNEIDEIKRDGMLGSIFNITTLETTLYGKRVTVSDGTVSKHAEFDNTGSATIKSYESVGNLHFSSTDNTRTAQYDLSVPYYGVYDVELNFWAATVNITALSVILYGQTVTIKKDNVTVGTCVLSAQGVGVYTATEPGNYIFEISYEDGGVMKTVTQSLTVSEETTYNISFSVGFDLQEWLTAGGVSGTYANLAAVLADEEAVRQLMTKHASVDYLASFEDDDSSVVTILNNDYAAKWISLRDYAEDTLEAAYGTLMGTIGKYGYGEWGITDATTTPPTWGALGNVPVMTSNTAPYGEASASSIFDSRYAVYNVFSDEFSKSWVSTVNEATSWIQYKFVNPVCVKEARIYFNFAGTAPEKTFKIQGSNDGSTFTDMGTFTPQSGFMLASLTNENYYLYYRLSFPNGMWNTSSNYWYIGSLQFYGRTLRVSVPKMSGNTTPYGEASATSIYSAGYEAYRAFDKTSTPWIPGVGQTNNRLSYKFNQKVRAKKAYITTGGATQYNNFDATFTIHGSNDGTTWSEALATFVSPKLTTATSITQVVDLPDGTNYQYYSLFVARALVAASSYEKDVIEFQIFGKDYSEREWDTEHPRHYIYDHGVELEALTGHASGTASVTEEAAQIKVYCGSNSNSKCEWNSDEKIDITDYNLIRAVSGLAAIYASGFSAFLAVASAKSGDFIVGQTGFAYAGITSENAQNNHSFDISSINGEYYIGVGRANIVITETIEELWLE